MVVNDLLLNEVTELFQESLFLISSRWPRENEENRLNHL